MNNLEQTLNTATIQAQQNSSSFSWDDVLYPVAAFGVLAVMAALLIFTVVGIVSVVRSQNLAGAGKFLWIVLMFCFPFIAPLVWFLGGRNWPLSADSAASESTAQSI